MHILFKWFWRFVRTILIQCKHIFFLNLVLSHSSFSFFFLKIHQHYYCFCVVNVFFFFFRLCHLACGILVPQPEIERGPSTVKAKSPNHWTSGEFPVNIFLLSFKQALKRKSLKTLCIWLNTWHQQVQNHSLKKKIMHA